MTLKVKNNLSLVEREIIFADCSGVSLYEGEKPVKIDIDDFYDVITGEQYFGDILIEAQKPVYTSPISQAAAALGKIKTPKKAAASRENGKKGGRPKRYTNTLDSNNQS